MGRIEPTAAYVQSILHYDPATGIFTWRERSDRSQQWNGRFAGRVAGSIGTNGYIYIDIQGRATLAHRIAWLLVHGALPSSHIDHINMVTDDNRIDNLRAATVSQNFFNKGKTSRNTSGLKCIYFDKQSQKWCFDLKVNRKRVARYKSKCRADVYLRYVVALDKHVGKFGRAA
ncbi:HNH endonuclease [Hyphomicrobium sp.]|uniref:HNH endonuclease n=1 Tax=Hyphomicrobium sp. TaxID=82 RepID=UPI003567BA1C